MPSPRQSTENTTGFHEAVAQWRLDVRTEVKRTSSLPTAMFDACDPMLEARLAETAEAMLACLLEPAPTMANQQGGDVEKRIEIVVPEELRRLPLQLAMPRNAVVDLDVGLDGEFLVALADSCSVATGQAQQSAIALLAQVLGVQRTDCLEAAARQLLARVEPSPGDNDEHDATSLSNLCRQVAAAIVAHHDARAPEAKAGDR